MVMEDMTERIFENYNKMGWPEEFGIDCKYNPNDSVANILLENWIFCVANEKYGITKNRKWRLQYDGDALCLNSLYSDTMISFWTPYKTAIARVVNKELSKDIQMPKIGKNAETFKFLYENRNDFVEVNDVFQKFASVCSTKGNYMLLPDRKMQYRYSCTQDRIDFTLSLCFSDNACDKLSRFFAGDENLREWIIREHLYFLFEGAVNHDGTIDREKITKENVISMMNSELHESGVNDRYGREQPYKLYGAMSDNELNRFIQNAEVIIKKRYFK